MAQELQWMSASEMAQEIKTENLSAREVARGLIEAVERVNPKINAIIHWDPDQVLEDAQRLDDKQAREGISGPLHGVPYTIKDLTAVEGLPLTMGIRSLKDSIAPNDAPIVERMKAADGLFLGKTNTPEAGYCGKTTNHLFGATRNPWDTSLSAGGSSGGAGAAVAAGLGPLAEGSDGGGSIRVPASLNGVVGFKPSTGRIPMTALQQRFMTNLFHGPLTRTVTDAALMLDVAAGEDPRDPLSLPDPGKSYVESLNGDLSGWRIAYSPDLGYAEVDAEVAEIVANAVQHFADAGATVVEATPQWEHPNEIMWNGVWVPGLAGLSHVFPLEEMKDELDAELIELIRYGDKLTVTDFSVADAARGRFYDAYNTFMNDYEILASPTTTVASYSVDRFAPEYLDGQPLRDRLLSWCLTPAFNMTTSPTISIPCGFTSDGRPVGLQLAGRHHRDEQVLNAAFAFEQLQPWVDHKPSVAVQDV